MENLNVLNNSDMMSLAPSIFAEKPYHKVNENVYSFIPTIKAIDYLRDSGWRPVQAQEVRPRLDEKRGFQKHLIRFSRPDLIVNGNRMDLLLYNSHDAGSSFKLVGGVFRFVCSNGMVVGDKMMEFSHMHRGFSPDKFIISAADINNRMENISNVIGAWQAIDLSPDEKGVYAMAALQASYDEPEKMPFTPDHLLLPRRYDDRNKNNLWSTFNTVQENIIKGGARAYDRNRGRRARLRAVTSIDRDKKINQALWTLTEKMAELKAH